MCVSFMEYIEFFLNKWIRDASIYRLAPLVHLDRWKSQSCCSCKFHTTFYYSTWKKRAVNFHMHSMQLNSVCYLCLAQTWNALQRAINKYCSFIHTAPAKVKVTSSECQKGQILFASILVRNIWKSDFCYGSIKKPVC